MSGYIPWLIYALKRQHGREGGGKRPVSSTGLSNGRIGSFGAKATASHVVQRQSSEWKMQSRKSTMRTRRAKAETQPELENLKKCSREAAEAS
ncbi:hypothetical protein A7C99_2227 [Trichophyton rubrum]|uniref:Uncharacterized protein n=1 Tax=Trichophyton rubrum TaxID=5551 RepID=A0A178F5F8_TRIRU|nr:hypothetical protein A7C99_2227 [Trichophyton rubrum]